MNFMYKHHICIYIDAGTCRNFLSLSRFCNKSLQTYFQMFLFRCKIEMKQGMTQKQGDMALLLAHNQGTYPIIIYLKQMSGGFTQDDSRVQLWLLECLANSQVYPKLKRCTDKTMNHQLLLVYNIVILSN